MAAIVTTTKSVSTSNFQISNLLTLPDFVGGSNLEKLSG
jgi:hypothetical protein